MTFLLLPQKRKFFEIYARGAKNAVETATTYHDLLKNYRLDHPHIQKIRDLEHEGDLITHEAIDRLNRTLFAPFNRQVIYDLASAIDNIVDAIQAVSDRMQMFRVEGQDPHAQKLANILRQATIEVEKAVLEVAHFKNARRVLDHCVEIHRFENEGDAALKEAIENLFKGTPAPLHVIKWKEVYEITEEAIDRCDDVANLIEGIAVKNG